MNELRFEARVAGRPCSANRMWRIAGPRRRGQKRRMYLTDAAADWEMAIICDVREQLATERVRANWNWAGMPSIGVTMTFYGVRGDIDNYTKCSLDGLKQALEIDDRRFGPITVRLGDKRDGRFHATAGALIEIVIPQPPAQDLPEEEWPCAPGSLRAIDLIDPGALDRVAPPLTSVRVFDAAAYGAIVLLFPPSELSDRDSEWGTFLPLAQARELRDALNALDLEAAGAREAVVGK